VAANGLRGRPPRAGLTGVAMVNGELVVSDIKVYVVQKPQVSLFYHSQGRVTSFFFGLSPKV
jgi:hypothetical protein